MSIQALPDSTVCILGSSQVLTDPASAVKELIDNALDAKATSIFVEIAVNSLDVIQVRDNGHGIAPDDRALVARRYCTSKIRDLSDLKDLGGRFLGFRGEALASAAELSGSVVITTRVEGEDVAVSLKFTRQGEVEKQDRASHPVGTTVRLNDVLKCLPVRKQTALKSSVKTLAKIKRMLQAYAFARPTTRFSLRVLKAKNDKTNWMYAPSANAKVEDAAFKIVGQSCAGQCDWTVVNHDDFEIQAFLPRPDASGSKISNIGSFIFVDSRPVSTTRGTLKQINTLYKTRLRSSNSVLDDVKDPFIWLNIVCPPQSYDPNIEPAKDDVMFEDSEKVLEAVRILLDGFYPSANEDESEPADKVTAAAQRHATSCHDDIPILVADEHPKLSGLSDDDIESVSGLQDITVSNPWVTAKLHSSNRPKRTSSLRNGRLLTPLQERNHSDTNSQSLTEEVTFPPHPPWTLPTPANSSSPIRPEHVLLDDSPQPPARTELLEQTFDVTGDDQLPPQPKRWKGWTAVNDFVPAAEMPLGTPYAADVESHSPVRPSTRPRNTNINKLFVSPVRDDAQVWFNQLPKRAVVNKQVASTTREQNIADLDMQHLCDTVERPPKRRRRHESFAESDADEDSQDDGEVNTGPTQATIESFFAAQTDQENSRVPRHERIPAQEARDVHLSFGRIAPLATKIDPETVPRPDTSRFNRAVSRTMSRTANLPLERVPAGSELHRLLSHISISMHELALSLQQAVDLTRGQNTSFEAMPTWGMPARSPLLDEEVYVHETGFDQPDMTKAESDMWAERLDEILRTLGNDEMAPETTDSQTTGLASALRNALKSRCGSEQDAAVM